MRGMKSTSAPSSGMWLLHIGVRPVGAPQHAVGEALDDAARERDHVVVAGGPDFDRRSGQLTFDQMFGCSSQQPQEVRELGAVDRLADIGRPMWSTTTVVGRLVKKSHSSRQVLRLEVDDDVPAERRDALGDLGEHLARREVDQAA